MNTDGNIELSPNQIADLRKAKQTAINLKESIRKMQQAGITSDVTEQEVQKRIDDIDKMLRVYDK